MVLDILTSSISGLLVKFINQEKISKDQYIVHKIFFEVLIYEFILKQDCFYSLGTTQTEMSKLGNRPLNYPVLGPGKELATINKKQEDQYFPTSSNVICEQAPPLQCPSADVFTWFPRVKQWSNSLKERFISKHQHFSSFFCMLNLAVQ